MKPLDYYSRNPVAYPNKNEFRTNYWYSSGRVIATQHGEDEISYASGVSHEDINNGIKETIWDDAALATARAAYAVQQARLHDEFVADLYEELDIADNPKREKLYLKAYEKGHAHGFEEVLAIAGSFVELIKD